MKLTSLLVCADPSSVDAINRALEELGIQVELCEDAARGLVRLAQARFDLLVVDTEMRGDVVALLNDSRAARANESILAVAMVSGQERVREMFALGVNFILYKPVSHERAVSSLRAAQSVALREKRRQKRAPVHATAVIDYAGVQQARATLVDLAEDGMAAHLSDKVPPRCKVYFQFQLPGQSASVRLSGQVMWQDWNGRAGLQFVDLPKASRNVLRQWLQTRSLPSSTPSSAAEVLPVEHRRRASTDGGLVHFGGKKQDLSRNKSGRGGGNEATANRRGETRYICRLGAEVYQRGSSVRNYCHVSDLSAGGCYLEMPVVFETAMPVELVVRTHEMKLQLGGVVKSSHPGYGMGVAFHLRTRSERRGVQQLIDFVAAAAEKA